MNKPLNEVLDVVLTFLIGLAPGALGATAAVLIDRALTWTQRFVAISVGIVVSYFVQGAAHAAFSNDFLLQAVGFSTGLVAYKAVPKFTDQASDVIASIPGRIRDKFLPEK